jgi:hypothetical protein
VGSAGFADGKGAKEEEKVQVYTTPSPGVFGQVSTKNSVIVVVIVPVLLVMPTVRVFIPPPMTVLPAVVASIREVLASVLGFGTLRPMLGDGFVEVMICLYGAFLAVIIGVNDVNGRRGGERKRAC